MNIEEATLIILVFSVLFLTYLYLRIETALDKTVKIMESSIKKQIELADIIKTQQEQIKGLGLRFNELGKIVEETLDIMKEFEK